MSSASTIYDVRVKYTLDDKATSGVKTLARNTDRAAQSASTLKLALTGIGGIAIFKAGKNLLVDFNSQIQQMQIGLTAVMQMQLQMPFEKARVEADKLFKIFQELAKKSPATTKDFMEMGNAIAPTVALLGGGPDKIAKLAQGGVLASQAFGERADVVARDITQMLRGLVTVRDPLANQLLGSRRIDRDQFNQMSGSKRAALTESMLQDPALLKAADQMGESFQGQLSTLKDQFQITFAKAGLPLMQSMTAELKQWNTWIEKHPKLISQWLTSFGEGVRSGFEFVKSVAMWFIDNGDLLKDLAKTVVLMKGAQIAGNVFKRFTEGVGSLADTAKRAAAGFATGGLTGATGALGGFNKLATGLFTKVIPGLALFSAGLDVATALLSSKNAEDKKAREAAIGLNEATGDFPDSTKRLNFIEAFMKSNRDPALQERLLRERDNLSAKLYNPENLGATFRKISDAAEKHGGEGFGFRNQKNFDIRALRAALPTTFDPRNLQENARIIKEVHAFLEVFSNLRSDLKEEALKTAFPEQYGMPTPKETPAPSTTWTGTGKPEVNVTINRIEIASEDPDRFVFGLVDIANNAIKHATQSQHTTPGGF